METDQEQRPTPFDGDLDQTWRSFGDFARGCIKVIPLKLLNISGWLLLLSWVVHSWAKLYPLLPKNRFIYWKIYCWRFPLSCAVFAFDLLTDQSGIFFKHNCMWKTKITKEERWHRSEMRHSKTPLGTQQWVHAAGKSCFTKTPAADVPQAAAQCHLEEPGATLETRKIEHSPEFSLTQVSPTFVQVCIASIRWRWGHGEGADVCLGRWEDGSVSVWLLILFPHRTNPSLILFGKCDATRSGAVPGIVSLPGHTPATEHRRSQKHKRAEGCVKVAQLSQMRGLKLCCAESQAAVLFVLITDCPR